MNSFLLVYSWETLTPDITTTKNLRTNYRGDIEKIKGFAHFKVQMRMSADYFATQNRERWQTPQRRALVWVAVFCIRWWRDVKCTRLYHERTILSASVHFCAVSAHVPVHIEIVVFFAMRLHFICCVYTSSCCASESNAAEPSLSNPQPSRLDQEREFTSHPLVLVNAGRKTRRIFRAMINKWISALALHIPHYDTQTR